MIIGFLYLIFMGIVYIKKRVIVLPTIKVWIGLIIVLLIYTIVRNMDMFIYLIPTEV